MSVHCSLRVRGGSTIGRRFAERPNAFNALRLVLATAVLIWHAWLYSESRLDLAWPLRQVLEELPVDAFFVLSGFLITASWTRRPSLPAFGLARAGRLLPGLWVCLAFSAMVLEPLTSRANELPGAQLPEKLGYVVGNAAVFVTQPDLGGVQHWNLSLWTLWWEVCCYVAIATLGRLGLLRIGVVGAIAFSAWLMAIALLPLGDIAGIHWADAGPRLTLMFALGSLCWLLKDSIPFHPSLAAAALLALVAASFTPDYRVFAAPALAYFVLFAGLWAGNFGRLRLTNDLSYGMYIYGMPSQRIWMSAGAANSWPMLASSATLALVLAAGSWLLVERPALRWTRTRLARHQARKTARWSPHPERGGNELSAA